MKFLILLLSLIFLPYSLLAQSEDPTTVFTKSYNGPVKKPVTVIDTFNAPDITDDYYLSVQSINGGCSLTEITINNKKVTNLNNLIKLKKHLIKVNLETINKIAVKVNGRKSSVVEVKILKLGAFTPVLQETVSGKSKEIINRQFNVENTDYDHILMVESENASILQNLIQIKLNNKVIVQPTEFIFSKKKSFLKIINPQLQNNISFQFLGPKTAKIKVSVLSPQINSIIRQVSTGGGTVTLPNTGAVTFEQNAFLSNSNVSVAKTHTEQTLKDFETSSVLYNLEERVSYEVRINTGMNQPIGDFTTELSVPESISSTINSNESLVVFAQIFQHYDLANLDTFQLFESEYDPLTKKLRTTLPDIAFTDLRNEDATYEAILIIAKVSSDGNLTMAKLNVSVTAICGSTPLAPPLDGELVVRDAFNPMGKPKGHYGTDYRAVTGTPVKSMASGTVYAIGYDLQDTPDRFGNPIKGWGNYVVIRNSDGSTALYAHLQDGTINTIKKNDPVNAGQIIASSDSSGGVTGPHLHVEYAPNGIWYNKSSQVDVSLCIKKLPEEKKYYWYSITAKDTGGADPGGRYDSVSFTLQGTGGDLQNGAGDVQLYASMSENTNNLVPLAPLSAPNGFELEIRPFFIYKDFGYFKVTLGEGLMFADGTKVLEVKIPSLFPTYPIYYRQTYKVIVVPSSREAYH